MHCTTARVSFRFVFHADSDRGRKDRVALGSRVFISVVQMIPRSINSYVKLNATCDTRKCDSDGNYRCATTAIHRMATAPSG